MTGPSSTHWHDYHIRDLTMARVMARQAAERPDKVYLRTTLGQTLTYRELDLATNRLVNWLRGLGAAPGLHVGVMMDNSRECLLVLMALAKAGIVAVPINVSARGPQLSHYLNSADVGWVVADGQFAARLAEVAAEVPAIDTLILGGEATGETTFRRTLALAGWEAASDAPVDDASVHSDLAFILFTSGTTGPSKGIMFGQSRAFLWDEGVVTDLDVGAHDTYLVTTPLSHASGLFSGAWMMLAVGGTVAVAPRFSVSRFWDDVRGTGATFTTLLGAMVAFLESAPASPADRDNPMRMISAGPYPATWRSFEERFGLKLVSGYGLSDHSAPTKLPLDAPDEKRGSAGRVIASFEMMIVDDDDMEVAPGVIGECLLRARAPWRASGGYYKQPEATVASRRNEWFHTGDTGRLDADGYFWYVGRKKDAIRRRGENISAYEVEQFVGAHPDVDQVAAYPLRSEQSEDEVAVSIVLRPDVTSDAPTIARRLIEAMPDHMVPRFIHVATELPRNLNQRVEKYKLVEWCEAHRSEIWDRELDPDLGRRRPARSIRTEPAAAS